MAGSEIIREVPVLYIYAEAPGTEPGITLAELNEAVVQHPADALAAVNILLQGGDVQELGVESSPKRRLGDLTLRALEVTDNGNRLLRTSDEHTFDQLLEDQTYREACRALSSARTDGSMEEIAAATRRAAFVGLMFFISRRIAYNMQQNAA